LKDFTGLSVLISGRVVQKHSVKILKMSQPIKTFSDREMLHFSGLARWYY
jgi:hypothetical protein